MPAWSISFDSVPVPFTQEQQRIWKNGTKPILQAKPAEPPSLTHQFALVHSEEFETNVEARRREAQVKRWSRAKKEALVSGDMDKLRELSKSRRKS